MFPQEIWRNPFWCLYDDMKGNTMLMYPWRDSMEVPCPRCGIPLNITNYHASCCGYNLKTGWGAIRQVIPFGTHDRASGRGWASLRPAPNPIE